MWYAPNRMYRLTRLDRAIKKTNMRIRTLLTTAFFSVSVMALTAQAVTINLLEVGSPGNPGDSVDSRSVGSVSYIYEIAATEITNAQYVEFLNNVAATDTYGLFNTSMTTDVQGGITRSGSPGSYTYATKSATYADVPVNFVTVPSSARFANWMHNGQGNGDTETGSYTFTDATTFSRSVNATWVLPNEDEWHKAAFFNPGGNDYNDYANTSNSLPASTTPPGTAPAANYARIGAGLLLTDVGAYTGTVTEFGAFDMNGNVSEITETIKSATSNYFFFGGDFASLSGDLLNTNFSNTISPTNSASNVGFRLAYIPEPSSLLLLTFAASALVMRRRNSRNAV